MNLSILLFFFFGCSINATKYQIHKKTNGFDHRPNIPESPLQLYRITQYFEKKRLITMLENPQIPLHVKTRMIEDRDIKAPNIYSGGLMRDFLFDMDCEN